MYREIVTAVHGWRRGRRRGRWGRWGREWCRRVVAGAVARIRGRLACHGDELPAVRPVFQREPQHAVHAGDAHLAVGDRRAERVGTRPAARADHELSNSAGLVEGAAGGLRREPLVVVLVPREHDVRAGVVQRLPQRLRLRHAAVGAAGAEPWVVPVSEGTVLRMGGEIGPDPLLLGRAGTGRGDAVARHDMPGAEIVAVITLGRIARRGPEVGQVVGGGAVADCCGAWDSRHLVNTPPASRIAAAARAKAWRRDIRAAYLIGPSPWSTDPDRTSSGRSPKKQNRPGGSPTQPVSRFAPPGVWASRTTSHPEDHSI